MKETAGFKVAVRCMTYNQATYIEDAMNGFCMQKTNYPFVCIVMDDASTDSEQVVINNYLKCHFDLEDKGVVKKEDTENYTLIFARHKENKNCFFAVYLLKYNHYGSLELKKKKWQYMYEWEAGADYIAMCEGDDYWIDPNKLQRQYEALEHNPDCFICFHRVQAVSPNKDKLELKIPKVQWEERKIHIEDHIHEQFHHDFCFQTSSFFVKREILYEYFKMCDGIFKLFPVGDLPIIWTALLRGPGYYIHKISSCYRRFSGGYTSRVVQNPNRAIILNEKFIDAYREFDEYTNHRYQDEFDYSITKHELNIISIKREPLKILKKRYLAIFRDRGLKFTVLYLWSFFPFHFNMMAKLEKLKSNLTSKRN